MKDFYINLNSYVLKKAIVWLIRENIEDYKINIKDVFFNNKTHMLEIKGKHFLCYDRHLHYPRKSEHIYAA